MRTVQSEFPPWTSFCSMDKTNKQRAHWEGTGITWNTTSGAESECDKAGLATISTFLIRSNSQTEVSFSTQAITIIYNNRNSYLPALSRNTSHSHPTNQPNSCSVRVQQGTTEHEGWICYEALSLQLFLSNKLKRFGGWQEGKKYHL